MEINLYLADKPEQLTCFTDYFNENDIVYKIFRISSWNNVNFYIDDKLLFDFSKFISSFIFDIYLKEILISKLYDEYFIFNTKDASLILIGISERISELSIKNDILNILTCKAKINPESYFLFIGKKYMNSIYKLTEEAVCKFVLEGEHR